MMKLWLLFTAPVDSLLVRYAIYGFVIGVEVCWYT